jgi:hypothetical protein
MTRDDPHGAAQGGVEGEMPPFWGVAASFVYVLFRLVVYAPAESSGRWLLLGRNMGQTGHIRDRLLLGPVRRWRNCRGITSLLAQYQQKQFERSQRQLERQVSS